MVEFELNGYKYTEIYSIDQYTILNVKRLGTSYMRPYTQDNFYMLQCKKCKFFISHNIGKLTHFVVRNGEIIDCDDKTCTIKDIDIVVNLMN